MSSRVSRGGRSAPLFDALPTVALCRILVSQSMPAASSLFLRVGESVPLLNAWRWLSCQRPSLKPPFVTNVFGMMRIPYSSSL